MRFVTFIAKRTALASKKKQMIRSFVSKLHFDPQGISDDSEPFLAQPAFHK
jgi:hypothetical protein